MIIDAHIHCSGDEKTDDVLRALDETGVDKTVLLAPFLNGNHFMHDGDSTRTERGKAARKWAGEKFELSESVSQTSELLSSLAKMRTKTRYHSELSIETCDGDVKKAPRTVFHGKSKSSYDRRAGVAGWDGSKETK